MLAPQRSQVREDLARLPGLMDRVDALVEEGLIGGAAPNAADLQILTSIRLLIAHEDLRSAIAPRPCGKAALRLIPDYPRSGPDALPGAGLPPPAWLLAARADTGPPTARQSRPKRAADRPLTHRH